MSTRNMIIWTLEERKEVKRKSLLLWEKGLQTMWECVRIVVSDMPSSRRRPTKDALPFAWVLPNVDVNALTVNSTHLRPMMHERNTKGWGFNLKSSPDAEDYVAPNRVERQPEPTKVSPEPEERTESRAVFEVVAKADPIIAKTLNELKSDVAKLQDSGQILAALDTLPKRIAEELVTTFENSTGFMMLLSALEHLKPSAKFTSVPDITVPPVAKASPKAERKTILVLNLMSEQAQELSGTYRQFDFKFWNGSNDTVDRLRSMVKHADRIYGCTRFMKHSQDEVVAALAKDRYVRCNGGTSMLKRIIQQTEGI